MRQGSVMTDIINKTNLETGSLEVMRWKKGLIQNIQRIIMTMWKNIAETLKISPQINHLI